MHETLPLLVSSGMDGRIMIWELPPDLLSPSLQFPSRLPPPRPHLPLSTPAPPRAAPLLLPGPPIFSTNTIHQGCWVDQVRWNSRHGTEVVSKASKPHVWDREMPRSSIQIWRANVVELLAPPEGITEEGMSMVEHWETTKAAVREQRGGFPVPDANSLDSSLAYVVLNEVVLEDRNYIGDQFAHRQETQTRRDGSDGGSVSLALVSTRENALYTFQNPSEPSSVPSTQDPTLEDLFPAERESEFEFHPRLLPEWVGDSLPGMAHFRHLAFDERGEWLVGVGDRGKLAIWRRGGVRN